MNVSIKAGRSAIGHFKNRPSKRGLVSLNTAGKIIDEYWTLIKYYSDVESAGLKLVKDKTGLVGSSAKKRYKQFRAYIKQAENYFLASQNLNYKTAPLLLYYTFLCLVQATILINDKDVTPEDFRHGLIGVKNKNLPLEKHCIKVDNNPKGVFRLFYKLVFKKDIALSSLNIIKMLRYCIDIQYQLQIAGIEGSKIFPCESTILTSTNNKECWSFIGIGRFSDSKVYKKSLSNFHNYFEEVSYQNKMFMKEALGLEPFEQKAYNFFQSKKTHNSTISIPVQQIDMEIIDALDGLFQFNYYDNGGSFLLSQPYSVNNQVSFNEFLSIYCVIFYLSDLVRYSPDLLDKLLDSKHAWLIESFVKFTPDTFLKFIVSLITDSDYMIVKKY